MEQIRLENEQIEVTVNIHGAELRSLKSKADGQEYLWNADAKYWGRTSPVLFPFVGGVKNKVYRHEGKEYPMNLSVSFPFGDWIQTGRNSWQGNVESKKYK